MYTLKIRKIGGSYGAIFPKEALNDLCVREGDTVYAVKSDAGTLSLISHDPNLEMQMKAFAKGCKRYKDALKELSGK